MKRFEEIPHTADWSFRAFGRDRRELFENAAYAMFAMEGAIPPQGQRPEIVREVQVKGIDWESLLVNWLSELLYLQESNRETYHRFEISYISAADLQARVYGTPNGKIEKLVKAATYHNLQIVETPEGWQATVVVDV
ncbi:MAG: archease [Chloroflexi bacterium]|nr:archease [Chloroflexota bacterium]